MTTELMTAKNSLALVAGLVALASQGAFSEDATVAPAKPEVGQDQAVITVTAPRQAIEIASPELESDLSATIESLNRLLAKELEQRMDAIEAERIELAIAEVPTRG